MNGFIGWYLTLLLLGLMVFPLTFRLLPGLADRGYTFGKVIGLLLVGYTFWILGTLGLLQNNTGGIAFAIVVVGGISVWAYVSRPDQDESLVAWLRDNRNLVIIAESLFLLAFIGWAIVRSYNPDISGTEKPMELAFLNGVRLSETFPPRDPWLSGYAISYYYFGYVMVAMLADLTNTISSVAFNLGVAMLFGLTLLSAYGVVYNLVAARDDDKDQPDKGQWAVSALLAPILVGVMGNLEGFLEWVHQRSLAAEIIKRCTDGLWLPFNQAICRASTGENFLGLGQGFWTWLDIENLVDPVTVATAPENWRFWWWWRASRVIRDRDITGEAIGLQPIDEFPFFSFLLGDMHPHVLALPFVLMALGLAFNALNQKEGISRVQFGLYALVFGGLAFLNTWDLPIYTFILIVALALRPIQQSGVIIFKEMLRPALIGLGILAVGIVAYLPWYIGFTSQAGGILPNAIFATRLHQFLVMFGVFMVVLVWWLLDEVIRNRRRVDWLNGALAGLGILIILVAIVLGIGAIALQADPNVLGFVVTSTGLTTETSIGDIMRVIIQHRMSQPFTPLLLTGMLILVIGRLLPRPPFTDDQVDDQGDRSPFSTSTGFVLILVLTGLLLTLGPEFVYLRDNFGQRLNTIFKFYYAAWALFGVATAYAAHVLLTRQKAVLRTIFGVVLVGGIGAGLFYPILATPNKAASFTSTEMLPTLDGIAYIQNRYPGDYGGIMWLSQNADPDSVIVEAIGGSYSYFGRVSSSTGLPTVMGWPGHEGQWRGDLYGEMAGSRVGDVKEIYNTISFARAQELLDRYDVRYVFVGSQEKGYGSEPGLLKFDRFFQVVYRDNDAAIYDIEQPLTQASE